MTDQPTHRVEIEIESLGAQGDGIAHHNGATLYVPRALPGERWQVDETDGGNPSAKFTRLTDSEDRATPVCRHFGTCGGCMSQHMSPKLYASWKHAIVKDAFAHRGIAADVKPVITVPDKTRRRAFLGVERRGKNVLIGFREEGDHALVDMEECHVLAPAIVSALPALREMSLTIMRDSVGGRIVVTQADQGLDIAFENARKDLSAEEQQALAQRALEQNFVRLAVNGDTIVAAADPILAIADVDVRPPIGIFLQAVKDAEAHLVSHVTNAIPKRARTAVDLFSGIGTLTFPLARRMTVSAFDSERRAIDTLNDAARHAKGLKPIEARVRDLMREPLSARELNAFDVAVIDPPRAGAADQAERLAASKVPTVIAVSCNPATLARDAKILIDGGYKMDAVTPIDQFRYAAHIEAVTVFRRPVKRGLGR